MKEKYQDTLIIIKPDALQRSLLGDIISRFEKKGLQIKAVKMLKMGDVIIEEHYQHHLTKPFFPGLKSFMKTAPVVVMVLSGIEAISAVRLLVGPVDGAKADAGSIRGDFSLNTQSNIVHASDSIESAAAEIKRFFKDDEIFDYNKPDAPYIYANEAIWD